jgi:hypothetical protein
MDEPISFGRIAKELARLSGRLEINDSERRRIALDLFEWAERGEFAENDVLMRTTAGAAQQFEPFLPAYRVKRGKEWQKGRALAGDPDSDVYRPAFEPYSPPQITGTNRKEIIQQTIDLQHEFQKRAMGRIPRVRINMQAIFLRRPALLHYLRTCDLEGAPRVLRKWFPRPDTANIDELAASGVDPSNAEPAVIEAAEQSIDSGNTAPPSLSIHDIKGRSPKTKKAPGPKPDICNECKQKMLTHLKEGRRTVEELNADTLLVLATEYGASPNTAKKARELAIAEFCRVSEICRIS